MAAAMTVASRLQRTRLRYAGLLTQAGQRVIFTEEGDDGTTLTPLALQGGGNVRDILGDAETLMAQLGQMFGGRARLGVAHFGHAPDFVAERHETRLDRINAAPNVIAIVHLASCAKV